MGVVKCMFRGIEEGEESGEGEMVLKRGIPLMWLVGGIFTVLEKNRDTVAGKPKILAHVVFTEGLLLSTGKTEEYFVDRKFVAQGKGIIFLLSMNTLSDVYLKLFWKKIIQTLIRHC